jgi:hypothetical protein
VLRLFDLLPAIAERAGKKGRQRLRSAATIRVDAV